MAVPVRRVEQFGLRPAEAQPALAGSIALVDRIYSTLTPFYDLVFGPILQPGRRTAI